MNPVSVFKEITNRGQIRDALDGIKQKAEQDAAATMARVSAQQQRADMWEGQQVDAAFDARDRLELADVQARAALERTNLTVAAANERARMSHVDASTNTHTDNARQMASAEAAKAYLESVGRSDLFPAVQSSFAAKDEALSRTRWDSAVKAAGTMAEINELRKRPEFAKYGSSPEFATAESGAREADRRYGTSEAHRRSTEERLAAAAEEAKKKKSSTGGASANQRRVLENDILKASRDLARTKNPNERKLLQDHLDTLNRLKTEYSGGGSSLSPDLLAELRSLAKD